MIKGSCLCGQIVFSVAKFVPLAGHCHCHMCQKFHGAAFSTFGEVKRKHLTWLQGQNLLQDYRAENETVRSFCRHCGSSLLFESRYNRQALTVEIALAAMDDSVDIKPDAHIYLESKVCWLEVNDDLAKFERYRTPQKS
ncbi:GFA family protein [Colwellia sp. MEBiC06753]